MHAVTWAGIQVAELKTTGVTVKYSNKYMLLTGREVRISKNCARWPWGLRLWAILKTGGTVFPNTDRTWPVNNIILCFSRFHWKLTQLLCNVESCNEVVNPSARERYSTWLQQLFQQHLAKNQTNTTWEPQKSWPRVVSFPSGIVECQYIPAHAKLDSSE